MSKRPRPGLPAAPDSEEDEGELYVPLKRRRELSRASVEEKARLLRRVHARDSTEDMEVDESERKPSAAAAPAPVVRKAADRHTTESLLTVASKLREEEALNPHADRDRAKREEENMLHQVSALQKPSLVSAVEHAKGIVYTESLTTSWRPPAHIRAMGNDAAVSECLCVLV